jgi:hypothetical protein
VFGGWQKQNKLQVPQVSSEKLTVNLVSCNSTVMGETAQNNWKLKGKSARLP